MSAKSRLILVAIFYVIFFICGIIGGPIAYSHGIVYFLIELGIVILGSIYFGKEIGKASYNYERSK